MIKLISICLMANMALSSRLILDGRKIKSLEDVFKTLKVSPKKSNFEALYDTLAEEDAIQASSINLKHLNNLKGRMGNEFVDNLTKTIRNAADDTRHFVLMVEL